MLGKILLIVSGLAFGGYGIACFLSPELPAAYAGLEITRGDAYAELGGMYGGLQIGYGLFCLLCGLRGDLRRAGLILLLMSVGGLALGRLYSAWDAEWLVGGYTWGAIAYEGTTAVLAAVALRR